MAEPARETLPKALQALYHHPDKAVKDQANRRARSVLAAGNSLSFEDTIRCSPPLVVAGSSVQAVRNLESLIMRAALSFISKHSWLENFQQTAEAWMVTDALLHDAASPFEVQLFCAQTLRCKVQRDFEELPQGAAGSLRDSLVTLALRFGGGPAAVRTQLCLSLAGLAAHMPSEQWGPQGLLAWLAERLSREPPEKALPVLLELLLVLPQEVGAFRAAVRPERRRAFIQELAAQCTTALQLLTTCLGSPVHGAREQVLAAFAPWVRLSQGVHDGILNSDAQIEPAVLAQHPLTSAALEGLNRDETFDAAVDAVSELVRCTTMGDPDAPEADPRAAPLAAVLVPRIMQLRPRFAADARSEDGSDGDVAKGLARLFAEVGESYVALIATGAPDVLAPVEALLDVCGHPDDEVAAISFLFWQRLSRAVTMPVEAPESRSSQALPPPPPDPSTDTERARRRGLFVPAFARLVESIQGRVRYPEDFANWRKDERADFRRARYAVADTLVEAAAVLGGEATLNLLVRPLSELSASTANGGSFDWREAEAALYCIRSVAKEAPPPTSQLLGNILRALPTLPLVPEVQYTCALVIGAHSDWISKAAACGTVPPELAGALLEHLMRVMEMGGSSETGNDARSAAALALKHVCDAGVTRISPAFLQPLLVVYRRVLDGDATDQSGGPSSSGSPAICLESDDVLTVVEAVSTAVASAPDEATAADGLRVILGPVFQTLETILPQLPEFYQGQPPPPPPRPKLVHDQFQRLSSVLRCVHSSKHAGTGAMLAPDAWRLIERALRSCGEERVGEQVCRALKYLIRTSGPRAAPLVGPLCQLLPVLFQQRRFACLVFAASELVKAFSELPEARPQLVALLHAIVREAASFLVRPEDFAQSPDVADDVFLLANAALRISPEVVVSAQNFDALLGMATAGMLVQHREASESALTFVLRALSPTRAPEHGAALAATVPKHGPRLARHLLAAAGGAIPFSRLDLVADALHAFLLLGPDAALQMVQAAVAAIPENVASPHDRESLMQALQYAAHTKGRGGLGPLTDAVGEFGMLCRRTNRSQAAVVAALVSA